jgi:hypothetical protein
MFAAFAGAVVWLYVTVPEYRRGNGHSSFNR